MSRREPAVPAVRVIPAGAGRRHLTLDVRNGVYTVQSLPGAGLTRDVTRGALRQMQLPPVSPEAANELLASTTGLALRVVAGATAVLDGESGGRVWRLDSDASLAWDEIEQRAASLYEQPSAGCSPTAKEEGP